MADVSNRAAFFQRCLLLEEKVAAVADDKLHAFVRDDLEKLLTRDPFPTEAPTKEAQSD